MVETRLSLEPEVFPGERGVVVVSTPPCRATESVAAGTYRRRGSINSKVAVRRLAVHILRGVRRSKRLYDGFLSLQNVAPTHHTSSSFPVIVAHARALS